MDYVLGFAFSKDGQSIALIRKDRPTWQAGKLNGIGGKVEPGEPIIKAMAREFKEETGRYTLPQDWRYFAKFTFEGGEVHCFTTSMERLDELHCPESETIEVHDVSLVGKEQTCPNLNFLIPMAQTDGIEFADINQQ